MDKYFIKPEAWRLFCIQTGKDPSSARPTTPQPIAAAPSHPPFHNYVSLAFPHWWFSESDLELATENVECPMPADPPQNTPSIRCEIIDYHSRVTIDTVDLAFIPHPGEFVSLWDDPVWVRYKVYLREAFPIDAIVQAKVMVRPEKPPSSI